jgi:hypothetical protein
MIIEKLNLKGLAHDSRASGSIASLATIESPDMPADEYRIPI